MSPLRVLDDLPVFPGTTSPTDPSVWRLHLEGRLARPRTYAQADLRQLPQADLVLPFRCAEGWEVPQVVWNGVPVEELLRAAEPLPSARFAIAACRDYTVLLSFDDLRAGLVALGRNGSPLEPTHGAPARLVLPAGNCALSVKWLDRLSLLDRPAATTGEARARARLEAAHPSIR